MSEEGHVCAVAPDQVRRVGLVGAGVIGGGWALHYLRMGFDVDVYDPGPKASHGVATMLAEIWPLLERIGLRPGASPDRIAFHTDLDAAVANADMVQENTPEDGPAKRRVIAARRDHRVKHLRVRDDHAAGRLQAPRTVRSRPSI